MKSNLVSLANTSVAGSYIFSGSRIDTKPFNNEGEYFGNTVSLNALVGSQNELKYNMDGQDIFLGKDADYFKSVTTNVKHLNQKELHLDVMTKDRKALPSQEIYITANDTIRDLVGDINDDETDNPNTVFYLRGKSPTGDSIKHKFKLNPDDTISTLLNRIEKTYQNTVSATLNDWGQIVVKDKNAGSSLLEFHLVGATDFKATSGSGEADVDELDKLIENKNLHIINFTKSGDTPIKTITKVDAIPDRYRDNEFSMNIDFTYLNQKAEQDTKIQDILGQIDELNFNGKKLDGSDVTNHTFSIDGNTTFQNLIDDIKNTFAGNMTDLEIIVRDGEISFKDTTAEPTKGDSSATKSNFVLNIEAKKGGNNIDAFSSSQGVTLDKEYFHKNITTLTSNVRQYINNTSDYAIDSTKLSEVSGLNTLDKNSFTLNLKDINGVDKEVFINLRNDTINQTAVATGTATAGNEITLDENFKDLKIGSIISDGTNYLKVTEIDLQNKKIKLDGDTSGTDLTFIEPYQEAKVMDNSGDNTILEFKNNMELHIGDKININGTEITVKKVINETKIEIDPATTFNDDDLAQAEKTETNSYFTIDGKDYSIFNENFDLRDTKLAKGKNDTQKTTANSTKTSIELDTAFTPMAEKGDYIFFKEQYRKLDSVSADGKTLNFSRDLNFVPTNGAEINLIKTGLIQLDKNFKETPAVGDYLRVGNDYLEITDFDLTKNTISVKPQYDGVIYEDDEIDLVKPITTKGDNVTYRQLSDIMSMVISDNLPIEDNKQPAYYDAVRASRKDVEIGLNDKGQLNIRDLKNHTTKIEFALFDTNSSKFEDTDGNKVIDNQGPALMFQANNALTIDDPHVDFFHRIDEAIEAVREGIYISDSDSVNSRNTGVQGAIEMIDHLSDHMSKMQTVAGSQTNALDYSIERTEMMVLHIKTLKSEVMDLDLAEASIRLQQTSLNYQAMLSTISKVNKLSLVNYI